MWQRETTARSSDIEAVFGRRGKGQSLWGFAAEQSEAGRSEKPQCLWRPAWVVPTELSGDLECPVVWRKRFNISGSDVAARDVQAATSPANQIAHARTKSRSFAGGGTGQGGKPERQSPSL